MNHTLMFIAAALAFLVLALPARRNPLRIIPTLWDLVRSELGVTVTWGFPVQSATGPTAPQASRCNVQTMTVFMADADTQAALTHNWGLPASFPTFLFPEIIWWAQLQTSTVSTAVTQITFGISNTNVVFMNKSATGAGTGGTFTVILRKPHSLGDGFWPAS